MLRVLTSWRLLQTDSVPVKTTGYQARLTVAHHVIHVKCALSCDQTTSVQSNRRVNATAPFTARTPSVSCASLCLKRTSRSTKITRLNILSKAAVVKSTFLRTRIANRLATTRSLLVNTRPKKGKSQGIKFKNKSSKT